MGCTASKTQTNAVATGNGKRDSSLTETASPLAQIQNLTSTAYSVTEPPHDWQDTVFLVPHEWVRREMMALETSIMALPSSGSSSSSLPKDQLWKVQNLAKWIKEFFCVIVHMHHDNEENIYLPMLKNNGAAIPEDKIAKDHGDLMAELAKLEDTATQLLEGKSNADTFIQKLQASVPAFVKDMMEHLQEEETVFPKIIRDADIPLELHQKTVGDIVQAGGLVGLQTELPGLLVAMQEWAQPEFYNDFLDHELPPPIKDLALKVFIPNYLNIHCALRDSPTMKTPPPMKEVPFEPSMLPGPPPSADN